MDVAGGDARDPQALRQAGEPAVASHVAPPQRPLELDAKAVAAEGAHQALTQRHRGGGLGAGRLTPSALEDPRERAVASAAGEADQAFSALLQGRKRQQRGEGVPPGGATCAPSEARAHHSSGA